MNSEQHESEPADQDEPESVQPDNSRLAKLRRWVIIAVAVVATIELALLAVIAARPHS